MAFYGTPGVPAMGVLGAGSPEQVWPRLAEQARRYRRPLHPVLPAFELIATIATKRPGPDGLYRHRLAPSVIDTYLAAARRHDALLILDIQPGQAGFLAEAKRLRPWLAEPDVALALDPEWRMGPGEVPGEEVGSVGASEVSGVSRWLERLTAAHRLPQKLLLVHQFTGDMVANKRDVRQRRHVAVTFNMDGFGVPADKKAQYRMLARHHRFPLGFKLFYHQDVNLLSHRQVLHLHPPPHVIEYQ